MSNALSIVILLCLAALGPTLKLPLIASLAFVAVAIISAAISIPAVRRMEANLMARVEAAERDEPPPPLS